MSERRDTAGEVVWTEAPEALEAEVSEVDYRGMSVRELVRVLASAEPVPGGGGAAALVGALGMALGNMVAALTLGKPKYAEVEAEVAELRQRGEALQERLLEQMNADAEGFRPLAAAYRLPKTDPVRAEVLEQATLRACGAPMEVMELSAAAVPVIEQLAEKGSRMAVSDAGCAAAAVRAAMEMAYLNLLINTRSLRGREQAEALNARGRELLTEAEKRTEKIYAAVRDGLARKEGE